MAPHRKRDKTRLTVRRRSLGRGWQKAEFNSSRDVCQTDGEDMTGAGQSECFDESEKRNPWMLISEQARPAEPACRKCSPQVNGAAQSADPCLQKRPVRPVFVGLCFDISGKFPVATRVARSDHAAIDPQIPHLYYRGYGTYKKDSLDRKTTASNAVTPT